MHYAINLQHPWTALHAPYLNTQPTEMGPLTMCPVYKRVYMQTLFQYSPLVQQVIRGRRAYFLWQSVWVRSSRSKQTSKVATGFCPCINLAPAPKVAYESIFLNRNQVRLWHIYDPSQWGVRENPENCWKVFLNNTTEKKNVSFFPWPLSCLCYLQLQQAFCNQKRKRPEEGRHGQQRWCWSAHLLNATIVLLNGWHWHLPSSGFLGIWNGASLRCINPTTRN